MTDNKQQKKSDHGASSRDAKTIVASTHTASPAASTKTLHSQPTTLASPRPQSTADAATQHDASQASDGLGEIGVGTRIRDRFVLKDELGSGGMGSVFKALDLRKKEAGDTNPYIAIKLLNASFEQHPKAFVSLQREAKKTQELAHPNIVTVYDFDRQGSTVFLTMEQLKGHPLNDIMMRRTSLSLSDSAKLSVIREIAAGLGYAHSKGIVHSDLKPANVFYTDDARVKILDFGIARAANEELYQDGFDAGELGALTYPYASPEMIRFEQPHPADDVYALGIIAAELFTGKHPFAGKDAETARKEKLAPAISKIKNRGIRKQVRAALLFDRRQRTQDAAIFLRRLNRSLALPKQLAAVAGIAVLALAANFYYLSTVETGTIDFADLAPAEQASFQAHMEEASQALRFNDVQAAAVAINEAYAIHSSNDALPAARQQVVDILQNAIDQAPSPRERDLLLGDVKELQQYPAFSETTFR